MPTAAKLVAALCFALVGWLAANAHVPALGEGAAVGRFREITALIGALVGWRILGAAAGKGHVEAMGRGLTAAAMLAFFALLGFSTYQMVIGSLRGQYGSSPMAAVLGIFQLMMTNARNMISPGVLGVLILGGLLGGMATEGASRRWR